MSHKRDRPFDSKVILVVGGATGIGRATALLFAAAGAAAVVVGDKAHEEANEVAAAIRELGADSQAIHVDVRDSASIAELVRTVRGRFGRIDVAFNNAGVGHDPEPLEEIDEAEWDRVLAVNLKGVWLCLKHELALMTAPGGAIVNTASVVGLRGFPAAAAYIAAKHGVVGLTRVAAVEFAGRGIRVNCVCPGHVDTPIFRANNIDDPGAGARITADYLIPRLIEPVEVAEAVCWLASDASSYVNGHALVLDGGESIRWR